MPKFNFNTIARTEKADVNKIGENFTEIENNALANSDIVDNLTSIDTNKPLSANQGKLLKDLVDNTYTKTEVDTKLVKYIIGSTLPTISSDENDGGIIRLGNLKIQYGILRNITAPATGYKEYTQDFPYAFDYTPIAVATPKGNYDITCQINPINTRMQINVRSNTGSEITNRNIGWIAIGV